MHVIVARHKAEKQLLHIVRQIKPRHVAILHDRLCYLLMRPLVFVLRRVQRQLAHVFHVYLLSIFRAIDPSGEIAKFPVSQANEAVWHDADLRCFCEVHGQILILW